MVAAVDSALRVQAVDFIFLGTSNCQHPQCPGTGRPEGQAETVALSVFGRHTVALSVFRRHLVGQVGRARRERAVASTPFLGA
jgi:hypothetical protein